MWLDPTKRCIRKLKLKRRFLESQFEIQRVFDLLLVLLLLPLWLPLSLAIGLIIWLSDVKASVFHRQKRVGLHGEVFYILKFRTMVKNAEAMKADLVPFNERIWPDFKMNNDPENHAYRTLPAQNKPGRITSVVERP